MSAKKTAEIPSSEIIRSLSVNKMARILESLGFVIQVLRSEDGKPAIRFLKLGIDGMALFFGETDGDQHRIVVLTAILPAAMPTERLNALNSRGVLPKVYASDKNTMIELCIPVEAGLAIEAVSYYVQSFEALLTTI
jgi:hypothetical protein